MYVVQDRWGLHPYQVKLVVIILKSDFLRIDIKMNIILRLGKLIWTNSSVMAPKSQVASLQLLSRYVLFHGCDSTALLCSHRQGGEESGNPANPWRIWKPLRSQRRWSLTRWKRKATEIRNCTQIFFQDTPEPSVKFVSVLLDIFLGTRLGLCLERTTLPSR